jgi:F-type H+-transporting ATPase subunit a
MMLAIGSQENFKVVPTADLNVTLALATLCLLIIQGTVIKKHGLWHYLQGWLAQPLGLAAFPLNILLRIVEECSRVFSLAMRLYGNMFAGEIIFALLALGPDWVRAPGIFGWCVFHILIVYLQAFIFMMLTVIGFSLALDH